MTALVTLLALAAGRGPSTFWALSAILTGQLWIGWTNDLVDADLDSRQGRADKPLSTTPKGGPERRLVRNAAIAAITLCVALSLANGLLAGILHLAAVGAATAYNLRLKSTLASFVPYAAAFGMLPSFVTLGLSAHKPAPIWATAAAAMIGVGGHLTQSLPDLARDRKEDVRGLPHRLGPTLSAVIAALALLAAAALVTLGPQPVSRLRLLALGAGAVLDAAILVTALSGRTLAAFRLTLASAGLVVAAFVGGGGSLNA